MKDRRSTAKEAAKVQELAVKLVVHDLNALYKANPWATRRGVNRWSANMRAKASLEKRERALKKELAVVRKRLG